MRGSVAWRFVAELLAAGLVGAITTTISCSAGGGASAGIEHLEIKTLAARRRARQAKFAELRQRRRTMSSTRSTTSEQAAVSERFHIRSEQALFKSASRPTRRTLQACSLCELEDAPRLFPSNVPGATQELHPQDQPHRRPGVRDFSATPKWVPFLGFASLYRHSERAGVGGDTLRLQNIRSC